MFSTLTSLFFASSGMQVGRHLLPPVDLAGVERRRRGGRIGNVDPLDAVDLDDLAAGRPRRRLLARHVVGVLHVHRPCCPAPTRALTNLNGPGADRLGDVRRRVGLRDALGHDERHVRRRLRERLERERERLLQLERERLVVRPPSTLRSPRRASGRARRASPSARSTRCSRPSAPAAPSWNLSPSRSVNVYVSLSSLTSYLSTICGCDLELRVGREQRVVDHVAVIAGDVRGGRDRVEDAQVGLRDELENLLPEPARPAQPAPPPAPARRSRRSNDIGHSCSSRILLGCV